MGPREETSQQCFRVFSHPGVVAACSELSDGNMSFACGDASEALLNRQRFCASLAIDHRSLVVPHQVHSSAVYHARESDRGRGALSPLDALPGVDALVTACRGLPVAVQTADCLPVFLIDPQTPAIGIVHAGWRSSAKGIVSATLMRMRALFGSEPGLLQAALGPSIRACCYEVSGEMRATFPQAVEARQGRWYLDLAKIALQELTAAGLCGDSIADCGACTSCRPEQFFSYRRQAEQSGRMISLIMLA